jgi:two-component system chemotaxis sensor kinase CheA
MTMDADLADVFRQEAAELLEQLEKALLDLEQRPDDRDLVNMAFRALHTIKGSGAMFGFEQVASFAHEFESAFDRVRKGETSPSRDLIAIALAAKDFIRSQIERPDETDAMAGVCIISDLRQLIAGNEPYSVETAAEPVVTSEADADPLVTWRIRISFHKDVLINGSNPLLLLAELRELGDCQVTVDTKAVPLLDAMEPTASYLRWEVFLTTTHPRAAIYDVFIFVMDDMDLDVQQETVAASRLAPSPAHPAAPAAERSPLPAEAIAAVHGENGRAQTDVSSQRAAAESRAPGKENSTIRVPAERLDEMMDRVGELVISQARLSQLTSSNGGGTKAVAEDIERLTAALRDAMMGIRMVPIGSLFGRFRRLIHDLSRDLGKEIELVTEGEDTELDKTMIEKLADPLVHIIRNSADHGLESPELRAAAGKVPAGRINLIARHAGAEVLISVIDDGRGLDTKRIRAKAEEQGLIAANAAMSDADINQMIFHPGFSTAKEVSALSGRGVGMDVVKRTIDGMRGKIDIATEAGRGTQITLRLPLTLAIIEGLLVRVADGRYVIPLTAVEECVELSELDDTRSEGRSFLNIRGDLVPFLRLRELFDESGTPDVHQKVVIVTVGDTRVGLVVDQIIGSHQTVIKSLSKLHADVPSFSGATILGDGTVALILDVLHLVALGQGREAHKKSAILEYA